MESKGIALKDQVAVGGELYHVIVVKFVKIGYTSIVLDDYGEPISSFPDECWQLIQHLREKLE